MSGDTEATTKPKRARKAAKVKKVKRVDVAAAMLALRSLKEAPADKTVKIGRTKIVFTPYVRKTLAKTIKATPTDKKADALALNILKAMEGREYKKTTWEDLVMETSKIAKPASVVAGSVRVPFVDRYFANRRGRKTVKLTYEAKKVIIQLP